MVSDQMPALVAHADWGSTPGKRHMALAVLERDRYLARTPEPVGDPKTLLKRLREIAGESGAVLIGFDFPIGLPAAYADRASIQSFPDLLPGLGQGDWTDFYRVAERPSDIGLRRPFYPYRPGGTKKRHLFDALGVASENELLRRCERAYVGRDAASSLFWTLGPKQVGKAAIIGWRDVLAPAVTSGDVTLWPFDGWLHDLLGSARTVIVETYPAEFYGHFGIVLNPGKRFQGARRDAAPALQRWATDAGIRLSPALCDDLADGFGGSSDGEDRFDAAIGLFGMLNVVLDRRAPGEPEDEHTRKIEGWMLGQAVVDNQSVDS